MSHPMGTCPYKLDDRHDCHGRNVHPMAVCNMVSDTHQVCQRYYRMADLHDHAPQLWAGDVCCQEYRYLLLECAETSGYYVGAVNIRLYPNDGKDVWRNYRRQWFRFCPFCGQPPKPGFYQLKGQEQYP